MYILHEADESKFVESANKIIARNKESRKSKLHNIRKARGFTQQELSDASGVSLRMIQLYEQKQNDIGKAQVSVVINLAKVLGCEIKKQPKMVAKRKSNQKWLLFKKSCAIIHLR